MLKHIPAILTPELLKILMEMGHGDEIVIADGNFPGAAIAKRLIRLDGHGVPEVLQAVMHFFPTGCLQRKASGVDGSSARRSGGSNDLGHLPRNYRQGRAETLRH